MDLSLSFSKYSTSKKCILKYIQTYITKPEVPKEPTSYPLVLGTLAHLFIYLYHDKNWEMNQIREMNKDLEKLHELIDLQFLGKDFKSGGYAVNTMDVSANTQETIQFIRDNEAVYWQAYKFFKMYIEDTLYKFENANIVSEFTFNNLFPMGDDMLCMYGSIDLIFWQLKQQKLLNYLYFADFKSGKSIDDYAMQQLYFYFYNILNYQFDSPIKKNPDNVNVIKELNGLMQNNTANIFGIIFKLRDSDSKKIVVNKDDQEYQKFVEEMLRHTEQVLLPLHRKKKTDIDLNSYKADFNDIFNYVAKDECKQKDESFHCRYCKFSSLCEHRMRG